MSRRMYASKQDETIRLASLRESRSGRRRERRAATDSSSQLGFAKSPSPILRQLGMLRRNAIRDRFRPAPKHSDTNMKIHHFMAHSLLAASILFATGCGGGDTAKNPDVPGPDSGATTSTPATDDTAPKEKTPRSAKLTNLADLEAEIQSHKGKVVVLDLWALW